MCGLNPAESGMRFFYFLLLMFITNVTMANFIRAIAFNAPSADAAVGTAPGFIIIFVFFSGVNLLHASCSRNRRGGRGEGIGQ